jgi:hypothetical protein
VDRRVLAFERVGRAAAPFRRFANGAGCADFHYDHPQRVDLAIGAALAIRRIVCSTRSAPSTNASFSITKRSISRSAPPTAGWETWFVPSSEAVHEGMGSAKGQYNVERAQAESRAASTGSSITGTRGTSRSSRRWSAGSRSTSSRRRCAGSRCADHPPQMIAPDAVVTFERVDGFRIVKSFGYAYGQASRPRNFLRATFRSIGAFIGLAPVEYLTDAERSRTECLAELVRKAE